MAQPEMINKFAGRIIAQLGVLGWPIGSPDSQPLKQKALSLLAEMRACAVETNALTHATVARTCEAAFVV